MADAARAFELSVEKQATVSLEFRQSYDVQDLSQKFPISFDNPNKQAVFELAGPQSNGSLCVSRWSGTCLPETICAHDVQVVSQDGFFDYVEWAVGEEHWYPNFAHSSLFVAWNSSLLAQDELQVLEHPILCTLPRALPMQHAVTAVGSKGTPVLIRGSERRCAIETLRSGLYGNAFARASRSECLAATQKLEPATITNLYCIEAPQGRGIYSSETISAVLRTAYVAFCGIRMEANDAGQRPVVHLGYWGCGAYGGNTTLMALLQLLAAQLAELPSVVFHLGRGAREGPEPLRRAQDLLARCAPAGAPLAQVLSAIEGEGFRWGVSDGN